jgi:tetratricopeptide (TPR) repeat protein
MRGKNNGEAQVIGSMGGDRRAPKELEERFAERARKAKEIETIGRLLFALGFDDYAERIVRSETESFFSPGRSRLLVEILISQGKYGEALPILEQINSQSEDEWSYARIGWIRLMAGDINRSFRMWTAQLFSPYFSHLDYAQHIPVPTDVRSLEGAWLFAMGHIEETQHRFDSAIRYLRPAQERLPENPLVNYKLGGAYSRVERYNAALPHLTIAVEKSGGQLRKAAELSLKYVKSKQPAEKSK